MQTVEHAVKSASIGFIHVWDGDETGSIEAGKSADLIVCDANPLEDLSRLRKLRYVMCRGNLVKNPRPRKMRNVEQALDRYM